MSGHDDAHHDPHAAPAPEPAPQPEPTALEALVARVPPFIWTLAVIAAGFWVLLGPLSGLIAQLMANFQMRRQERESMAPLLAAAQATKATYETAKPGQLVHWCIDHPHSGSAFVEGRVSSKLAWTNEAAVPVTNSVTSGGRCRGMLARVVERKPDALVLEYLGQP